MIWWLIIPTLGTSLRGVFSDSQCGCSCCVVAARPLTVQLNDVNSMCSIDPNGTCPEVCLTNDNVLGKLGSTVDYERFCFYECRPPERAQFGTGCTDLTSEQQQAVAANGGNGVDLASLTAAKELPTEISGHAAVAAANERHRKIAADTEVQSAVSEKITRHALTEIEAARRRTFEMAKFNLKEVAAIRGLQAEAEIHQAAAVEARKKTEAALQEIEEAPKKAAEIVAEEAKGIVLKHALFSEGKARNLELKYSPPPGWQGESAAETKARVPWNEAMNRAIATRNAYSVKAQDLSAQANAMQDSAGKLATTAAGYSSAANPHAGRMLANAEDMVREANRLEAAAKSNQDMAEYIHEHLPKYQTFGTHAAIRAAAGLD